MKRVKIMLVAITVLASIGGVLAFKAKTFGQQYCIRLWLRGAGACTASLKGKTQGAITTYYFTTTTNPANCISGNVQCVVTIKLTVEP